MFFSDRNQQTIGEFWLNSAEIEAANDPFGFELTAHFARAFATHLDGKLVEEGSVFLKARSEARQLQQLCSQVVGFREALFRNLDESTLP